jgi:hypothetical protein
MFNRNKWRMRKLAILRSSSAGQSAGRATTTPMGGRRVMVSIGTASFFARSVAGFETVGNGMRGYQGGGLVTSIWRRTSLPQGEPMTAGCHNLLEIFKPRRRRTSIGDCQQPVGTLHM